ncbi:MAG TPA: HD domain-containing protein [Gemmataceae bacterium]|nr:HD domain-containing protein [Gemmataceae bacterium]
MTDPAPDIQPLLRAIAFAARAHRSQVRKDGRTPYASHPFRVCLITRHVFGVTDNAALTAAALHDVIEDTTTDFDDVAEEFGAEVAGWVALLSKDKRLPEDEREAAYTAGLTAAPWQVQVCKLADVYDNLLDSAGAPPEQQGKRLRRSRQYLDALRAGLKPQAKAAWDLVAGLLGRMEAG